MMIISSVAMLLALFAQQPTPGDSIITRARAAIKPLADSVTLRDAGYSPIGFGAGTRDLTPFQGQHWISLGIFFTNAPVDLAKPTFMIFLPLGDSLVPIGVAYSRTLKLATPVPIDLAGAPVVWHLHTPCRAIPGEGQTLADGVEDCTARGGAAGANQIAMVHTWTIPNPDGPYAHDNPALPFIATGLKPPTPATRDDRLFGVALGESYGAKLAVAHRIERDAVKAGTQQPLQAPRAALRALVPQLRDAERAGDRARFESLRKRTIDAWNDLVTQYHAVAQTPEMRARFDLELEQAVGNAAHDHM